MTKFSIAPCPENWEACGYCGAFPEEACKYPDRETEGGRMARKTTPPPCGLGPSENCPAKCETHGCQYPADHVIKNGWVPKSETLTTSISPLPDESSARKEFPLATGLMDYFPAALAAVARCSFMSNQKHNPGKALQWSRPNSDDHADCLMRHFMGRGSVDGEGIRESARVAWRALAILQLELEAAGEAPEAITPRPTNPAESKA